MDLCHHGGAGMLVGGCMLAHFEALALDQPGQAGILVSKLGKRHIGTQILHSNILLRDMMLATSQCFLIDSFQLVLVTQMLAPLVLVLLVLVPVPPNEGFSVGLTCSIQLAGKCPRNPSSIFI